MYKADYNTVELPDDTADDDMEVSAVTSGRQRNHNIGMTTAARQLKNKMRRAKIYSSLDTEGPGVGPVANYSFDTNPKRYIVHMESMQNPGVIRHVTNPMSQKKQHMRNNGV